ncbi:aquaporin family protein [Rhodocytophaga rosea]|uniref:Aquaporin family protein n=1 Tax=Rhodocytophaga rosea TaxID=2704465 RepID=A0A6C0GHC8_9BACT|nr:MIP/aquaporin family protein [Rhodocytophaga rosea]QHT67436.1 aquaporin family protein [Rhodocytophaga rosea]
MSAFLGELVGTCLLIIFGGGVVAGSILKGTKAENSGWIVITIGWGLAVALSVYAVGDFSGAHLNPAVTLSLAVVGEFRWVDVPMYIIAQLIGAFLGATLVWLHYLPHWRETQDDTTKLAVFATNPAIRKPWANLFSELLGTFVLILGLQAIGANKFSDGLNPIVIGLLITGIGLSLGATTGYAINPARDLGPRIAHFVLPIYGKGSSDWSYAWVPIVGPCLGGMLGSLVYKAVFTNQVFGLLWVVVALTLIVIVVAVIKEREVVTAEENLKEKTKA